MSAKEPTRQEINERLQEIADAQPLTVYCRLCPEWEASGPALLARTQAELHRVNEHPELKTKKKITRRGRVWSQAMTEEREREIEEERRRRMRALGIP